MPKTRDIIAEQRKIVQQLQRLAASLRASSGTEYISESTRQHLLNAARSAENDIHSINFVYELQKERIK